MVESKSKKAFYFTAFILPCLVLYSIFCITPFTRGIGISLTNWDGLTPKTPIILEKSEFESKILSKIKNEADLKYVIGEKDENGNYVNGIYSYDKSDNCYKRTSVKGRERRKLERIIKKTGYEPERNKFVGLENYKKIFTGKVGDDFYPKTTYLNKFTKSSNLPTYISKKEFEKEILKSAKSRINVAGENLIKNAYIYNEKTQKYKLNSDYDEFDIVTPLWELPENVKTHEVTEKEIDNFVSSIKSLALLKQNSIAYEKAKLFITSNNLSEQSAKVVNSVVTELFRVAELKNVLSEAWVVKNRNMGVIGFTLFFAFFSVIGINFVAFCLALALDSGIKGQKIFRTIFFLPNVLSMIIVALIWSMLFVQLLPAVTGIEQWISDSAKTPWLLVLVAVWQGCGYYMIVYLAGLQNIPVDVIEAAKIDGATGWQRFRYVTLPLMIPSLTISLFLSIANALKSFDLIYAMIGSTGYATGTVPFVMDIYFDAFSLKQAGLATAKAMVLFVVIVLVTGIQLFTMKRKEVEA